MSVVNIGTHFTTSGSVLTLTSGTVPAGVLICVLITEANGSGTSAAKLTDSVGNSYSLAGQAPMGSAGNGFGAMFYVANARALSSGNALSYTLTNSSDNTSISAFYATGYATLDTGVTVTASIGSGASRTVTSGTPASSGELMVACGSIRSPANYVQDTADGWAAPFTAINLANASGAGGNQVNSGGSAKTYTPSWGSDQSISAVMVFGFEPTAVPVTEFNMPMLGF